jgi:hypothetical protein
MAAVAAFVGTAALAIALTRAPAHRDVSLSSDVSSQACATSGLEAWLGTGAAAGRTGGARIRPPLGTYIPVCANGHMALSVQAIQARPGVPGYTVAP